MPSRGQVYRIEVDPTRGSEIRKSRPCVVVSPDELNHHRRSGRLRKRLGTLSRAVRRRVFAILAEMFEL